VTLDPHGSDHTPEATGDDAPIGASGPTRRKVLALAGAGAATLGAAIGPFAHLLPAAAADESPDLALVTFIAGLELAAVDLYDTAATSTALEGAAKELASTVGEHHATHASTLGALISAGGGTAPTAGNAGLAAQYGPQVSGAADVAALAKVLQELEEAFAATYFAALGTIVSSTLASTAAQIMPVDAAHAVAWSAAPTTTPTDAGKPTAAAVPALQTDAGELTRSALGGSAGTTTSTTTGASS
jgi:hypothetical protein